jgi:hypothetical protein
MAARPTVLIDPTNGNRIAGADPRRDCYAATAMRSDAALPLSQAISPTWTGTHAFTANVTAPTVAPGTNTTQVATTAFVQANGPSGSQANSAAGNVSQSTSSYEMAGFAATITPARSGRVLVIQN